MIEIKNLNLFCGQTHLLKDIDFRLKTGSSVAILGPSGSGKSLFARSLVRLFDRRYKLKAEQFCVSGACGAPNVLALKNLRLYRQKMALIMQDATAALIPHLDIGSSFHLILKSHTDLAEPERKRRSFELLERLGFSDIELLWHSYPHTLSLGMARRINLALGLICAPEVLILDEITSSLDQQNCGKIAGILAALRGKMGLIIITHDLKLAQICDEVVLFDGGRASLAQNRAQFFEAKSPLATLYKEIYASS